MPITAKLSRQFYEKLGDEVTNELVTWLNAVDESYRAEFRELFGANFGQVRAEMAALRSDMHAGMTLLRSELRGDLDVLRSKLNGEIDALRVALNGKIDALRSELGGKTDSLRAEVRGDMASLHAELATLDHRVEKRLAAQKTELLFWMFLFWVGTVGALLLKTGL